MSSGVPKELFLSNMSQFPSSLFCYYIEIFPKHCKINHLCEALPKALVWKLVVGKVELKTDNSMVGFFVGFSGQVT